jgi:hypothetical protein
MNARTTLVGLVLLAGIVAFAASLAPAAEQATGPAGQPIIAAPVDGVIEMVVAAEATNGLIEIVIPRGTYLRIMSGELDAYNLPAVMNLHVGDRIVIHNEDDYPHILMYAFIRVGASDERVFTKTGTEVYTAGCTPSAADFAPFTTIFIAE